MRAVVVERLHLHPIGRPGEDEKKRASPEYENENGHADVQRDTSWRTDAAKVAAGSTMEAESECLNVFWYAQKDLLAVNPGQQQL